LQYYDIIIPLSFYFKRKLKFENFGIFSVIFCNKITGFLKLLYYNMKKLFFVCFAPKKNRINTDIFMFFEKRRIIRIFLKKSIDKLDFFIYNLLG